MLKAATKVITPGLCCEKFCGNCSGNWDTEIEKVKDDVYYYQNFTFQN